MEARARAGTEANPVTPIAASDERASEHPSVFERAHPPNEVAEIDRPPAQAAVGPRSLDDRTATLQRAAPPRAGSAPLQVELDTTEPPESVAVAPPPAAKPEEIRAAAQPKPPEAVPELGSDIADADAELRERVQRALGRSASLSYTAKHVHVEVVDQRVTLRGAVRTANERRELDQIVRGLPGVKRFRNRVALINPPQAAPRVE